MRIKSNPLVEYLNFSTEKSRKVMDYASRPLYSKNAPAVFTKKLKTVKLNIVIVIGKITQDHLRELLDNKYIVLNQIKPFQATATKIKIGESNFWDEHFKDVPRGYVLDFSQQGPIKTRLSPMTPFTVLHRFGDSCLPRSYNHEWSRKFSIVSTVGSRLPVIISSGVDTLAGRNGWFSSINEATSDLWAKYLLTGKICYNPEASPLDGSLWSEEEIYARRKYKQYLDELFPSKLNELEQTGGYFSI